MSDNHDENNIPMVNVQPAPMDDVIQDTPSQTDKLVENGKPARNYAETTTPTRLDENDQTISVTGSRVKNLEIRKIFRVKEKEKLVDKKRDSMIYKRTTDALAVVTEQDAFEKILDGMEEPIQLKRHGDSGIGIMKLTYTPPEDTSNLSNEEWALYTRSLTSLGERVRCDLVHSLFSVRIGDFDTDELLSLITSLNTLRSDIGTRTQGLLLSTEDAHLVVTIVDYILEHVSACSIKNWTIETIRRLLRVQDIPRLMAAALDSIYPDGYPLIRECTNSLEYDDTGKPKCDFSTLDESERLLHGLSLHFRRVMVTDDARLDDRCWNLLSSPWDSLSEENVINGQQHLWDINKGHRGWKQDELLGPVNDSGNALLYVRMAPPVYENYRREGMQWVQEVISMVESKIDQLEDEDEEVLSDEQKARRRVNYQTLQISLLEAQKWWPWVQEVVYKTPKGTIRQTDREKIRISLKDMSATEKTRKAFKEIMDANYPFFFYSYPAMAQYDCPKCGSPQKDADAYSGMIPLNMVPCFFAIAALTVRRYR